MPTVKNVGEPCAREPHARFDVAAGGNQASRQRRAVQAPPADPTGSSEDFLYVFKGGSLRSPPRAGCGRPQAAVLAARSRACTTPRCSAHRPPAGHPEPDSSAGRPRQAHRYAARFARTLPGLRLTAPTDSAHTAVTSGPSPRPATRSPRTTIRTPHRAHTSRGRTAAENPLGRSATVDVIPAIVSEELRNSVADVHGP